MNAMLRLKCGARCGFSLIEVLVSIGVIAVMMALALPALRHAREAGRRTVCINQLQQFGLAFTMYRDANRQRLPVALRAADVSVGEVEPFGAVSEYLTSPLPTWDGVRASHVPPYRCPSDGQYAEATGFSYHYWPLDFFQAWTGADPGAGVARLIEDDPSEPLLIDRWQHFELLPSVVNSGGHALWLDGRVGRPR